MHGLVACNIKIEVRRVLHLIGVPSGLDPVSYWETIIPTLLGIPWQPSEGVEGAERVPAQA